MGDSDDPNRRAEETGSAMKHASIRELYDYWNERRGVLAAPDRNDIDPGAIRHILADTFILAYDTHTGHPFRIAGTRVSAGFGRELKGEPFASLWAAASSPLVCDLLAVVGREAVGVVASAGGSSRAGALDLELVLLPLSHRGRTDVRVLGALAPVAIPGWFGTSPLGALTLGTLRYLTVDRMAPRGRTAIPLFPTGRVRHGLVVYDGGQS
jgi:hypothetical protein